jgi:uncharacterized OB-fold protein
MSAATRAETPAQPAEPEAEQAIREAAARVAAAGESSRRPGLYPVNQPMIDHWVTALDSYRFRSETVGGAPTDESAHDSVEGSADDSAVLAPPAMIQVWTMPGLRGRWGGDDPLTAMMTVLDQAGYTSVVATNCEQTYHRYLRDGERVSVSAHLETVTGPKRTALGEGWFVTTLNTWFVDDEPVAEMRFRVLKFRPPVAAASTGDPLRPVVSRDTEFFWAGTALRELRIQRCEDCGTVRHPPGPRCPACGSQRRGYLLAGGTGTIFSYVVHHHPPVSGRTAPFVVALIELSEGVRMLGELVDVDPLDPVAAATVQIGSPVQVTWRQVDDALTLPAWRIGAGG